MRIACLAWLVLLPLAAAGQTELHAEDARYVHENGVTYLETRRVERKPVAQIRWQEQRHTVYRDRFTTEMRETSRTYFTPVKEYHWQPRWHGWWNPFAPPHVAYHLVPQTRWEMRTDKIRIPVTSHHRVPETRVVQVPVRHLGFAEQETTRRVAVSPSVPSVRPQVQARRPASPRVVGIARLENDPPRQGTRATVLGGSGTLRR